MGKDKRKEQEDDGGKVAKKQRTEEEDDEPVVLTEEEKAAKKAKKEAKRLRKLQKREEQSAVDTEEVVVHETEEEDAKPEKKAKKDKKKDKGDKGMKTVVEEVLQAAAAAAKKTVVTSSGSGGVNHYVEHKTTKAMTTDEVDKFRSDQGIVVYPEEDSNSYKPMTTFSCLDSSLQDFCPNINAYLKRKAFTKPTAIQAQCWPPLLSGRDVIGIAMTGSGKTLTFLIPAILKISKAGLKGAPSGVPTPRVLVVAPTRELAMQSHQVVDEVGGLKGVCIYGGVPKPQQKADLRAGAEVTPLISHRLYDLQVTPLISYLSYIYPLL